MVKITLLGMNHKTAPVEIREQLALVCRQQANPLQSHGLLADIEEIFFLSTCNRVEFLFTSGGNSDGIDEVKRLLATHLGSDQDFNLDPYLYIHHGLDAVKHLFRVASSLDSMMVGEPQILGQIKTAYRDATQYRTAGVILNRLLHKAFTVAKRVRSETHIGSHAVSISYAAVELARKIFGELRDKQVLLIGAGEMAELAAENLLAQGVKRMLVCNRTLERALELARRFRVNTIAFEHLLDALKEVDIVLSSTGSPDPIIRREDVKPRMRGRRNRPLFFIDIAVPRDIDPKVNQLDNVYLYDIDDLQGVVDLNKMERQKEAEQAEHIIAAETLKFQDWLQTLEAVPTIISLRQKAEAIRRCQLDKTLAQLPNLDDKSRQAIEVLTESIVNKMLHDPILFLKKKGERSSQQLFVDFTQQLFNLADSTTPADGASLDSLDN
jgi:glutamyl-tRNA reductase